MFKAMPELSVGALQWGKIGLAGLQHKVCSLNCQPKPQHLESCFPLIQDAYKKGQHLRNYTNEGSGAQVFFSAQVCGSRFPTLAPQTFLHSTQHCTE